MATKPAKAHQNGQGVWLYKRAFATGFSDFFSFSDDSTLITDSESLLAVDTPSHLKSGPLSTADLLLHRYSDAAVLAHFPCHHPAILKELIFNSFNNTNVMPTYSTTAALTTVFSTTSPRPWPPEIDVSNVFYSDEVYCCPSTSIDNHNTQLTDTTVPFDALSHVIPNLRKTQKEKWLEKLSDKVKNSTDWTNTTIQSIFVTQNQQVIDKQYCQRENCGKGNYTYLIPLSKHIPPNMPITLQMTTTELLVIHLCSHDESKQCSSVLDYNGPESNTALNTQGYIHKWTLAVANHYHASYHFRSSVAGLADCNTDLNFAEVLFTDYHFHFFRRCD
ncbi:hypothetical protein cypCar_00029183 [Cyprinus carpio]|nr:hypothetical protein cypCar_00029183 [Cyprinus carpio]